MRRVTIFDPERKRYFAFWTNQWMLSPAIIPELYRNRWRIEIYFRWIKQNLRIRHFYGSSSNDVRLQLWIAICTYPRRRHHLSAVSQIVSVNAFQKNLSQLFGSALLCAKNDNFDN